jgi:poly(beta-D-mannuronate) lyase
VRDPNASFLDVAARREVLRNAQTPRLREAISHVKSCTGTEPPAVPPRWEDTSKRVFGFGLDDEKSDNHEFTKPFYRAQDVAAWGANNYLVTGDPAEATCVINALLPWAKKKAMLGYDAKEEAAVWYQSAFTTASLALSVSVIRAEPSLNPTDRDAVIDWLRRTASKAVGEERGPRAESNYNHHFFWRGLAATAAGIISNDDKLFTEGLRIYATALAEMDAQGAFPAEMTHHEIALRDQAFAIEPLVMIAELASRQGVNVYDLNETGHHLSDAVGFLTNAMADPWALEKYTPEPQKIIPDLEPGGQMLAWLEFWNRRHPKPSLAYLFDKPFSAVRVAGSTTLYAAPVNEPAPEMTEK